MPPTPDELFAKYHQQLVLFVYRRIGNEHDAEDIASETWLRCLGNMDKIAGRERPWLYHVARNCAISWLRERGRHRELLVEADDFKTVSNFREIAQLDVLLKAESLERLRWALDQLSINDQEIITLRMIDELLLEEVATILGCAISTAKNRTDRALRRLAHLLRDNPPDEPRPNPES